MCYYYPQTKKLFCKLILSPEYIDFILRLFLESQIPGIYIIDMNIKELCSYDNASKKQYLPYGFGDVTKCIDSGSADGFLVSLEQLEQFEANSHPLPG